MPVLDSLFEKVLPGQTREYQLLVLNCYARIIPLIFFKAQRHLWKGTYFHSKGDSEKGAREFLVGSKIWSESVIKKTKSTIKLWNEISPPQKHHFLFVNHTNEMDFPFDCYVIGKPYLANQTIKKTFFAYHWMKAMGSEVFDSSKQMSIAMSVKNIIRGLGTTSYIVYPEGRNTYTEEFQQIKKGMVKLAFENKIPIWMCVRSGAASFQKKQSGNTIHYKALGTANPTDFNSTEELLEHLQKTMSAGKAELNAKLEM